MARLAPPYRPRQPTRTVLYGVVREHLETFLAHARESYERPLPRYVEKEFRDYLRCGVFAHGFVHCRCESCGHDLLVALSCKGRGVCPSCMGRRMANTGAHLVDRVVPDVPVRQFVLSLPHELRRLAAFKPDVLTALSRIFAEVVFASYRKRAARLGIEGGQPGAITLVQRFGGSLNLHVHFHTCFLDGVFTRDMLGRVQFVALPRPQSGDLEAIVRRVRDRAFAWLKKRAASSADRESDPAAEPAALDACAAVAVQRGTFVKLADDPTTGEKEDAPTSPLAAKLHGFDLHAGVHIAAGDDLGREKLLRYGARPAFALDRLRRLSDGRIAYRVKYARGRSKYRVMTPVEFLARLAALIPPPKYPLVRFHGVLAPNSKWRKHVVPAPRSEGRACADGAASRPSERGQTRASEPAPPHWRAEGDSLVTQAPSTETRPRGDTASISATLASSTPSSLTRPDVAAQRPASTLGVISSVAATLLTPNVLSVSHWDRIGRGELHAASRRVPWRELLLRTFDVDVRECPACGDRLRVIGTVRSGWPVRAILERLGMPAVAPVPARARDPTELYAPEPSVSIDA